MHLWDILLSDIRTQVSTGISMYQYLSCNINAEQKHPGCKKVQDQ